MTGINLNRYAKKKEPVSDVHKDGSLLTFLNKEITFGKSELSDKKKEAMYMELGSLLHAGINLKNSFELIIADQNKEAEKQLFCAIQKNVLSGTTFAHALQNTGKFSLYEIHSLQIGEETGKLIEILQELAVFFQNKIKQRRKIVSALTYPTLVLSTSFGAVFFMLKFVVPMFGDVFKRFGGQLPWITQQIIDVSNALENNFYRFTICLLLIGAFVFSTRKTEKYRAFIAKTFLKIPVIGNIIKKVYLARFCNSMRLLINARLPLLRALSLSRQMIGYYPIESTLKFVEEGIIKGQPLHQSMEQFAIYPSKMIQLIKVGEETNQLDHFFARISDQYVQEVEYQTSTLSSMLEPLIIIFLGLVVGLILIAMYLPMFQMSNTIQ